jgi:hypothetical protein
MPKRYHGPRIWLDKSRGTWMIIDGAKRIRTGVSGEDKDKAEAALHEYANGSSYILGTPQGPKRNYKTPPRKGVYVLGFGDYIKIGVSANIDERMITLQTPEPVQLHALIDGWLSDEAELHRRFAKYRLQGEWFRKEGELADWVATLSQSQ